MKDAEVKESRRVLRLVQEHLSDAHLKVGSQQKSVGLVEVVHHPQSTLAHLNYVTPRKNTAWVPTPEVEKGMAQLRELNRAPRLSYIEGLFPPIFAKSLHTIGLKVVSETPIMVRKFAEGETQERSVSPPNIRLVEADDQQKLGVWWYVWKNAYYDVITSGIEPFKIGESMQAVTMGQETNLLMYRESLPIGVARVTHHKTTAHLTTLVMMKEFRQDHLVRALYQATYKVAQEQGCELIFTSGETEKDRQLCRDVGFLDVGSVVCYAEPSDDSTEETHDETVAQPLFAY